MTDTELAQFKEQVRREAIRVAETNGWCDSGLNETLRRLGLPEKRTYQVPVKYTTVRTGATWITVNDASSEAEAYDRVRNDPSLVHRSLGTHITEWEVPEPPAPPKMPEADSGVPVPGDPCPEEGEWYARSVVSGGPNQCRVVHEDTGVYCTRPVDHAVDWHVASGQTDGVLATWEAEEGDVRPTPAPEVVEDDDDDDED